MHSRPAALLVGRILPVFSLLAPVSGAVCASISGLLWAGCVAGVLSEAEYRDGLSGAGFDEVDIEPTRIYHEEDAGSAAVRCR